MNQIKKEIQRVFSKFKNIVLVDRNVIVIGDYYMGRYFMESLYK